MIMVQSRIVANEDFSSACDQKSPISQHCVATTKDIAGRRARIELFHLQSGAVE
jgi:hypothetical protein